jgi:hypothetical protein
MEDLYWELRECLLESVKLVKSSVKEEGNSPLSARSGAHFMDLKC